MAEGTIRDFWVCCHHRSYRHGPVTSGGRLHPCHFWMVAASGAMASCQWLWSKAKIRSSRSFSNTNCNMDGAFWSFHLRSRSERVRTTTTTRRLNQCAVPLCFAAPTFAALPGKTEKNGREDGGDILARFLPKLSVAFILVHPG